MRNVSLMLGALAFSVVGLACGGGSADAQRIGGECTTDGGCANPKLSCLTQFKGGYCGSSGCTKDTDCAAGAGCVAHEGTNYCFRQCAEKAECNANRTAANEANCVANITRLDGGSWKACVPPSGG